MGLTLPKLPFSIHTESKQLIGGGTINRLTGLLSSFLGSITATAAGTQTSSLILNNAFNELTTVASANDGVTLPPAKCGLRVTVTNSGGANSAQIFASGTDTINGTAGATGVALANGATAMFVCTKDGIWRRFVSA